MLGIKMVDNPYFGRPVQVRNKAVKCFSPHSQLGIAIANNVLAQKHVRLWR